MNRSRNRTMTRKLMRTMKQNTLMITAAFAGLMAATSVFAGPSTSGGGNAVVCFSDEKIPTRIRDKNDADYGAILDSEVSKITSVTGLDLYEAQQAVDIDTGEPVGIIQIGENESWKHYIFKIAQRLSAVEMSDAYSEEDLNKELREMFGVPNFYQQPFGLEKIDDIGFTGRIDRTHCVLATVIAQYGDPKSSSVQVHVDKRIFYHSTHSKLSRAVLFLHELTYKSFRAEGAKTSEEARELVKMAIMNHHMTAKEYIRRMVELIEKVIGKPLADDSQSFNSEYYAERYMSRVGSKFENALQELMNQSYQSNMTNALYGAVFDIDVFGGGYVSAKMPDGTYRNSYDCEPLNKKNFDWNVDSYDGWKVDNAIHAFPVCIEFLKAYTTQNPNNSKAVKLLEDIQKEKDAMEAAQSQVIQLSKTLFSKEAVQKMTDQPFVTANVKSRAQVGAEKFLVAFEKDVMQKPGYTFRNRYKKEGTQYNPAQRSFSAEYYALFFGTQNLLDYPIADIAE